MQNTKERKDWQDPHTLTYKNEVKTKLKKTNTTTTKKHITDRNKTRVYQKYFLDQLCQCRVFTFRK